MQDREMNRNLFRNHENRLYRNSFKDLNMLDTKKLDQEFYNQTMKTNVLICFKGWRKIIRGRFR